jgi:hypothetical protein
MTGYLKAIYGSVAAGLASADLALVDGHITWQEGVKIAIASVGAFAVIWGVPNAAPKK